MMNDFPTEEVLIARGKYSTLSSERRSIYKAVRDDVEVIVGSCQRALHNMEKDMEFSQEQAAIAKKRIDSVLTKLGQASHLTEHLNGLKPLAWGDKKETDA